MSRKRILVTAPYMQPVIHRFLPRFEERGCEVVVPPVNERMSEEELLRWVVDVDGVISGDDRFTERVLREAKSLKVISKWGTGIDSIDLDACRRLGIAVRNTPNAFSEPVADTVLGYILCFARGLPWMDRNMRRGVWAKAPARSLGECTIGVIGVGNVGKAVVRRAAAFGTRLLGNDPVPMPDTFLAETGLAMVPKEELLRESDFVSVNCDLNPTSRGLVGAGEFAVMKPSAVLINTARGPIVDEPALADALETGRIAGAALDVYVNEPLPDDSPLRAMDNVLLAPHNANSSPRAWERVHENTIRNLFEVLEGTR